MKDKIVNVFLIVMVLLFVIACTYRYQKEAGEHEVKIEKREDRKNEKETPEEPALKLKCAGLYLKEGEENKIEKVTLPSLEVTTPYDITNYKVLGQEGNVLKEGTYEKVTDTVVNSFKIEEATEQATQIRLIGFNKKMKKLDDKLFPVVIE